MGLVKHDPMISRRYRGRSVRGFGLLDLLVGVVIFALVFTTAARFVLTLSDASETALARSQVRREATQLRNALRDELLSASLCEDSRIDHPVLSVNDGSSGIPENQHSLIFRADLDGDGDPGLIGWRFHDGALERAAIDPGGCAGLDATDLNGEWDVISDAASLPEDGFAYFVRPLRDGTFYEHVGSCAGYESVRCEFDALRIHVVVDFGDAGPVLVDETVQVPSAGARGT